MTTDTPAQPAAPLLPSGLIRRSQFRHLVPFATNTLQRMVAAKKFPAPHPQASSAKLYFWDSAEIVAYVKGEWK